MALTYCSRCRKLCAQSPMKSPAASIAARMTTNRIVVGDGNARSATRGAAGVGERGGDALSATVMARHPAVTNAPAVESAMSPARAGSNPMASACW